MRHMVVAKPAVFVVTAAMRCLPQPTSVYPTSAEDPLPKSVALYAECIQPKVYAHIVVNCDSIIQV